MLSYLLSIIEKNLNQKLNSIYNNSKIQQFKENFVTFQKKLRFVLPERLFIHDVCNKKKLDINNFVLLYTESLNDILAEISHLYETVIKISDIISIIFQGIFEKMKTGIFEVKDFKDNDTIIEINNLLTCLDLKKYVIDMLNKKISEDNFLKYCLICMKNINLKALSIEAYSYENYGYYDLMISHSKFFIHCLIMNGMNQEYFPKSNNSFIDYFNKKNFIPILEEIKNINREAWKYVNYNLKSISKSIKDFDGEIDNKTDNVKKVKRNSHVSYVSNDDTALSYNDTNNYSDIDSLVNFINEKPNNKRKNCKIKDDIYKRYNRIYSENSTSDISKTKLFVDNSSETSNFGIAKKIDKKSLIEGKTCKISSFKSMKINHLSNIDKSVKEEKEEFSDNENYFKLYEAKKFLDSTKSINEEDEYFNISQKCNIKQNNEKHIFALDEYDDDRKVEEFRKNLIKDSFHTNYKWKINLEDEEEISL